MAGALFAKEQYKKKTPVLIDSINNSYYGQTEVKSQNVIYGGVLKDDYSFILSEYLGGVVEYSVTGNRTINYTDFLKNDETRTNQWAISKDSQNNVFLMFNGITEKAKYPYMYVFKDGEYVNKQRYYMPELLTPFVKLYNGKAYVTEYVTDTRTRKLYCLEPDFASPQEFDATLGGNGKYCIDNDGYIYVQQGWDKNGAVFVYDQDSDYINKISVPSSNVELTAVLPDKSILVMEYQSRSGSVYYRIANDSTILWRLKFPARVASFLDYNNGVYLFESEGSIYRYAESDAVLPEFLNQLKEINTYLSSVDVTKPFEYSKLSDLAELYAKEGGYLQAYNVLSEYLIYCPADTNAQEQKLRYELYLAKEQIRTAKTKAIDLYEIYGPETASDEYKNAMIYLERFMKLYPTDQDLINSYDELKEVFSDGEYESKSKIPELAVESVSFEPIFPVLMNYYQKEASGKLYLKNNSNETIKNILVTSNIKKYMDYPTESEVVKTLGSGQSAIIDLKTQFNDKILSIFDNTNLQLQILITWEQDGKIQKQVLTRTITIYSKSSISWKDTAMLSCFIMPKDTTVANFAFENLGKDGDYFISKKLTNAINLINAIGNIPLKYVPDPVAPANLILENEFAIDTVRFPSETLSLKGGDCDDMTTLVCSVLEAAGIETALMTNPGHIFAAFNTGLLYNSVWNLLPEDYLFLNVDGYVWIPIETTVLSNGFVESWKTASEELLQDNDEYLLSEFIIVSEARNIYPPVFISGTGEKVSVDKEQMEKINGDNKAELNQLFRSILGKENLALEDAYELNAIAKLYYSFGDYEKAIQILQMAVKKDANYRPAYQNLAKLYSLTNNKNEASKYEKKANSIKDSSKYEFVERASDNSDDTWDEEENERKGKKIQKGEMVRKNSVKVRSMESAKGAETIATRADEKNGEEWND